MRTKNSKEIEFAYSTALAILNRNINAQSLDEISIITAEDAEGKHTRLLEHIEIIIEILTKAKEQMEVENGKN